MKQFMVLYQSPVTGQERISQASPEQIQASMNEWIQWRKTVGEDVFEYGNPLTVGKRVEGKSVTAGRLTVSGYSLLKAESLDAAVELLKTHPFLKDPGSSIEVLEFLRMPGLGE